MSGLYTLLRRRFWPRWAILLLVAVLVRAPTFGNPILNLDEDFYFATARAVVEGALPYVDVWDRKPVGLFLLYVPAAALGVPLGIWAYQALALASVTATAAWIARLADRCGWGRGALPAALAYLLWLDLLQGEGGQTPVFYNLLMVGAASLIAPRADDATSEKRRFLVGCASLALVGLALQLKYSVVFEGAFFGLWWIWRERRLGRPWWQAVALAVPLAGLAAVPTLLAWGWFAAHGHDDAFVYANFRSIGERHPGTWAQQGTNLAIMLAILSPLLVLATLGARLPRSGATEGALQRWLIGWGIVAGTGVLVFGTYFDHYALPLLVPLCVCAAGFFALHRAAARVTVPLLSILACAALAVLVGKHHGRTQPAQFDAIVRAIGHGPGCLYVYSGSPMLYPYADRCVPTRYRFPSHLSRASERGAIGVDQQAEIDRIFARRPDVVVLSLPFRGERPELRASVLRELAAHYRRRADLPFGSDRVAVYARR